MTPPPGGGQGELLTNEEIAQIMDATEDFVGRSVLRLADELTNALAREEQLREQNADLAETLLARQNEGEEMREALEAIANGDYEGRKLWEHTLAAHILFASDQAQGER